MSKKNITEPHKAFLAVLLMLGAPVAWSGNITGPKIAFVSWNDNTFDNIEGQQMTFRKNWNPAIGVEYMHIFDSNIAIGVEFQYHQADLVAASFDPSPIYGYASVYQLFATGSYFFPINEKTKPFVGFGLGVSSIGINTDYDATLNGYAFQANTGIEFKFTRRVGLTLGYKLSYVTADDSHNELATYMQEINLRLNLYSAR